MSTLQGVVFDLDGTLLDTLADIAHAMNAVLARRGWPVHPPDAYRYFVGDGVERLVERALPPGQQRSTVLAECVREVGREYAARWRAQTRPYDGIPELLAALEARGVRMAVLSNKPEAFAREMVEYFFGAGRLAPVRGAQPGLPPKPDPAAALAIARELGLPPDQLAHVGDTPVDIETAHAAGMLAVGATWGFRPAEELRRAGADVLVHQPRELLPLFAHAGLG